MHDKFKKRQKTVRTDSRLRRQIAREAARRMISGRPNAEDPNAVNDLLWIDASTESDFLAAKRRAVAVLGHRVRPADLPTDEEVRIEILDSLRTGRTPAPDDSDAEPGEAGPAPVGRMSDHIDRFTLFKMWLAPLETVKQNPKTHPEGDALFHSLQVFELAKAQHPHDEEFLLAALLHDIGKAIDPRNHVVAGVEALRGTVTERTLWLVEHHMDLCPEPKHRRHVESSDPELLEDLKALRHFDDAGRVPGAPVGAVDEALDYLRRLEADEFSEDSPED